MSRKILLNVGPYESRGAILENGKLSELLYEIQDSEKIVGCIYKGRVANVVAGTQSAFVDIGIHKDAYLTLTGVDSGDSDDDLKDIYRSPIQDTLKVGQEVILQILKEPTPTKGPRSTMTISFPGRYLVFMPKVDHIGVSRRIQHDRERDRLRAIGRRIAPKGGGVVFRTASEGLEENVLKADLDLLIKMWNKVEQKIEKSPPRTMLHRDIPLPMKVARDFFSDDVDEMIIDSEEAYRSIMDDCEFLTPLQRASLELYKGKEPLFEKFGIEKEIEKALSRKIWLDSGGYLYIDKTEAMYCIDVNSGRFSGGSDLEETVFRLNLEAAREIARQIRLRNLSGMIIIDFIDMEAPSHRSQVLKTLRECFKGDRNKPNILDFSELGLVQMTRRRSAASLDEIRKEVCPCCQGAGKVVSARNVANSVRKQLMEECKRYQTEKMIINAHRLVADLLRGRDGKDLRDLERETDRKLILKPQNGFDIENWKIEPVMERTNKKNDRQPQQNRRNDNNARRGPGKASDNNQIEAPVEVPDEPETATEDEKNSEETTSVSD
ncbi:MAG: Ribonuclease G [Candidatus Rifleibacterium amylolyticum]|nr:MAG: Ribonuclease G [Candidatus Rifleibacterium amylolyticum]NLF95903.1 Rne/Rng family ribonuclease [Candidatus Riflebacteria bacterium]